MLQIFLVTNATDILNYYCFKYSFVFKSWAAFIIWKFCLYSIHSILHALFVIHNMGPLSLSFISRSLDPRIQDQEWGWRYTTFFKSFLETEVDSITTDVLNSKHNLASYILQSWYLVRHVCQWNYLSEIHKAYEIIYENLRTSYFE